MRAAQWLIRIALILLCVLDLWLMTRAAQYGPGLVAESAGGGSIRLLPVQWAAAGYAWLGGLISLQLLLIAAEVVLRGKLRRRPPQLRELALPARLKSLWTIWRIHGR